MLEFLDNYEEVSSSIYPSIAIDWITAFEIEYIKKQFSNYLTSLDEISEINRGNDLNNVEEDLDYNIEMDSNLEKVIEEEDKYEEFETDSLNSLFDGEEFSLEENGTADPFSDLFGDEYQDIENNDNIINELLEISESSVETNRNNDKIGDIFSCKIPIFVGDEKIAESNISKNTINVLNHFFKRKWVIRLSIHKEEEINEDFILRNILRL